MFRNAMNEMSGATILRQRLRTQKEYEYVKKFVEQNSTDVKIVDNVCVWCDATNCIMHNVDLLVSDDMLWHIGIVGFNNDLRHYIDAQTARDEDTKAEKEELEALREKVKYLEAKLAKKKRD